MTVLSRSEIKELHSAAARITSEVSSFVLSKFGSNFSYKKKKDTTLVTEVDVAAENLIRSKLQKLFPDHGFFGEEGSAVNRESDYIWIADPIDGTQSFVHGIPTFGSMLALWHRGESVVGAISLPALKMHYSAGKGMGCLFNGKRIKIENGTSGRFDQNDIVLVSSRGQFSRADKDYDFLFERITKSHKYVRTYYDCFGLTRAIHGQASVMVEMNVPAWDLAPCPVMVREAGGVYEQFELPQKKRAPVEKMYTAVFGRRPAVNWVKKLAGW